MNIILLTEVDGYGTMGRMKYRNMTRLCRICLNEHIGAWPYPYPHEFEPGEETIMSKHPKCEECGKPFSAETGRNYVQLIGGGYTDCCDSCATMLQGSLEDEE